MEWLSKAVGTLLYLLLVLVYYLVVGLGLVVGGYLATALVDSIAGTNYRERFSNWLERKRLERERSRARRKSEQDSESWERA